MAVQQIPTNIDKLTYVRGHELLAIREHYRGLPYQEIAEKIEERCRVTIKPATLRMWFYKNGRLNDVYGEYQEQMAKIEERATNDFIRGNLMAAAKTLMRVMQGKGGFAQVAAAKVFLDRGLGRVAKKSSTHEEKFSLRDFVELIH